MDKTILKNFAVESRKDLMDKIERKVSLYYVNESFDKSINGDVVVLSNDKHSITLTKKQSDNRDNLVRRINELGIEQVIEESAYTWFNRLVAIRYMEINDYLPLTKDNQSLGFRVLSSQDNTLDPEILKFTNLSNTSLDINFDPNKYSSLNNSDEKFKYVLLLVCKKLGKVIPQVFDGVTDYIDLLVPDNLLSTGSVLDKLIKIPEENFKEVEVIGWLYQYYNQTEKDRVINAKKQYKKNEIPYATQLFTPDWIVKYMVENSLGRYYVEHNGISDIINNWRYFIKDNLSIKNDRIDVSKIKCIDPCSGSGHILVYMFDILYQMYINEGYNKTDIPELILKNNLFGLDIDDRAGQLSILSVMLKAREYDKNIFNRDIVKDLNILSLQESKGIDTSYFEQDLITTLNIDYLIETFKDAKEIGSLLKVEKKDYSYALEKLGENILDLNLLEQIKPLIKQANILSNKYTIVITNPPYMNFTLMSDNLKKYVKKYYSEYSSDLFETSIRHFLDFLEDSSYYGCVTPYAWMFLKSYKDLRKYIIDNCDISSLVQLEYNSFEACALPVCIYVLSSSKLNREGIYIKLTDFQGVEIQEPKLIEALRNYDNCPYIYKTSIENYKLIELNPIAYWISNKEFELFKSGAKFGDYYSVKGGMTTGNNGLFMRNWYEVDFNKVGLGLTSEQAKKSNYKWFPYNKGGLYRKWYGNLEYIVDWKNDGEDIKKYKLEQRETDPNYNTAIAALDSMFKIQYSWSLLSGCNLSVRYYPVGCLFDVSGSSVVLEETNTYVLGLLNSNIVNRQLNFLNPTLNTQPGNIKSLVFIDNNEYKTEIDKLVNENIAISKVDWDSFETSWDFKKNCLLETKESLIKKNYLEFKNRCHQRILSLMQNEERLNKIYNKIYGLEDVVSSNVDEKNISLNKADNRKTIIEFISYAVGCMFGRYSLDEEGLIYAGGEWDISKYKTFIPDNDNIIPIADNNDIFYSDDIVGEFIKFVEIAFGKDTLRENLDYIAETLGKKGIETSEDTIRRYFLNDFYKDHLQIYQKKPIYWMFDSGKNNGFKCLIYMHRYNEQTVSKIKVDYFLKAQESYRNQLSSVQERLNGVNGLTTAEIKGLRNKEKDLTDKLKECKDYYEKLDHIANEMIKIDLDDGVKVNYAKFENILAKNK